MIKNKRSILHLHFLYNKKLLKCKRSQAHVEIMISFAIFIGVLVFVFLFLNPFAKAPENNNGIDSVEKIILEKLSYNVGKLSLVSYAADGCYYFDSNEYSDENFVETIESSSSSAVKYNVYFSKIFKARNAPHYTDSSNACSFDNYKLGVFTNNTMISYEGLKSLKSECEGNYDNCRKSNGINFDFAFTCKNLDGSAIVDASFSKQASFGVNVKSKEFPIRAIGDDGKIHEIIFNLKVW